MPERQTFESGQTDTGLKQRIRSADDHCLDKSWNYISEKDDLRQDLEQKNQGAEPRACGAPMRYSHSEGPEGSINLDSLESLKRSRAYKWNAMKNYYF